MGARITSITISADCPCGDLTSVEIEMTEDPGAGWETPMEERYHLCDTCSQVFDAGVSISVDRMKGVGG